MKNINLLEYAKCDLGKRQAWFGVNPQFDFDGIDIGSCTNFRLPPKFHGVYDSVWVFETPLNAYHVLSWKIILDEATRLLKRNGKLVVRLQETLELTASMVKNFIGRNANLNAKIEHEQTDKDFLTIVFDIERLDFEVYQDKSWTFAMLTGGQKDDVVIKFLESIRNSEPQKSQIIISGPKKEIYDRYDVEYLDLSKYRDDKYAEISRKKNDIAKMATGANILIAHDRYYLNDKFFSDFENYGYDFDFLAMCQKSEADNKEYPSYCYYYGEALENWHVGYSDCYSKLLNTQYVNGGLLVFKTNTLRKIKFNDLIFWNQKEDVEITLELSKRSIIPRVNFFSEIYTTRPSDEFPFDYFDGQKLHYNAPVTINKRPTLYGVEKNHNRFIDCKFYKKAHFPFFGFRIKFMKKG